MGGVQDLKLVDQRLGHREGFRRVQHEVTQELVQVTQVLGRLRFVQEAQRAVARDAEQACELALIPAEFVGKKHIRQSDFKLAHIEADAGLREELQFAQRELPFHHEKERVDVPVCRAIALDPKDPP